MCDEDQSGCCQTCIVIDGVQSSIEQQVADHQTAALLVQVVQVGLGRPLGQVQGVRVQELVGPEDKKRVLPCSAWLEGEFGLKGIYLGVPCKLGAGGLEEIIEVDLSKSEQTALKKSAESVKSVLDIVKL